MFRMIGGIALVASGFFLKKYLDDKLKEKCPDSYSYDFEDYKDAFKDIVVDGMDEAGKCAHSVGDWLKEKAKDMS